jgi:hypothetical protein
VVPEGQIIADAKASEVAALPWEELDTYGKRVEYVTAPSGQTFRLSSMAFWDMKEWQSDMNISVKAYAPSGFRRFWGYKAWTVRGPIGFPERPA